MSRITTVTRDEYNEMRYFATQYICDHDRL